MDPTTNVQGVEAYSKAVALLFDKDDSRADLISIEVSLSPPIYDAPRERFSFLCHERVKLLWCPKKGFLQAPEPNIIRTKWRFAASLNVPGKPKLKPYTGTTTYKLNTAGLVYEHREEWDISALDAFISILFPAFGAPPAPPIANPVGVQ